MLEEEKLIRSKPKFGRVIYISIRMPHHIIVFVFKSTSQISSRIFVIHFHSILVHRKLEWTGGNTHADGGTNEWATCSAIIPPLVSSVVDISGSVGPLHRLGREHVIMPDHECFYPHGIYCIINIYCCECGQMNA